ncbi:hypothetical protein GCM10009551_036260 [Nocardiopsis tropica]
MLHGVRSPVGREITLRDRIDAVLLLYPDAVFCGWTAAALHSVAYCAGKPTEVWLPEHRRRRGLVIRRCVLPEEDVVDVDGVAFTTGVRTAVDLARYIPGDDAVAAVDQCLRFDEAGRAATTVEEMRRYLDQHRNLHRSRRVAAVLGAADGRAESPPETHTRLALHRAGLTVFEPQVAIDRGRFRVDLGAEEYRVAVEYDGAHHRDPEQHRLDVERWNTLRHDYGWDIVLATASSLGGGRDALIRRARAALRDRGWSG